MIEQSSIIISSEAMREYFSNCLQLAMSELRDTRSRESAAVESQDTGKECCALVDEYETAKRLAVLFSFKGMHVHLTLSDALELKKLLGEY